LPRLIAARSEAGAIRQYLESFQEAIAAFAENVIFAQSRPHPKTRVRSLTMVSDDVVWLQDADGELRLALGIELSFRTVQIPGPPARWMVETTKYIYHLEGPADPANALVSYHWHPDVPGITYPHIHMLEAGSPARRMHVSIPHATVANAITTAMRDYNITALPAHRDTWEELLAAAGETLRGSLQPAETPWSPL